MSILNLKNCQAGTNTGSDPCDFEIKNTAGAFVAPPGFSLPASALADWPTFLAALKTACLAAPGSRIYPIHDIVQIGGTAPTSIVQNFNDGTMNKVRSGNFDAIYQMKSGGSCLWQKVKGFDGGKWSILRYDVDGTLIGATNDAGDLVFVNLSLFDTETPVENDGTKITQRAFHINAKPDFYKGIGLVPGDVLAIQNVKGLLTAKIKQNGARASGVVKVNVSLGCANSDLWATNASDFASTSMWVVKDSTTKNVVALLSVASNSTIGGWTITVDTSDPNYNAGNKLDITLTTPALINTAIPTLFIEGVTLTTAT